MPALHRSTVQSMPSLVQGSVLFLLSHVKSMQRSSVQMFESSQSALLSHSPFGAPALPPAPAPPPAPPAPPAPPPPPSHGSQPSPQSISLSRPFRTPSEQLCAMHVRLVQTPSSQSVPR